MKRKSFEEVVDLLSQEGLERGTSAFVEELDRRFVEDQGHFYERSMTADHFHGGKDDLMTTSDVVS